MRSLIRPTLLLSCAFLLAASLAHAAESRNWQSADGRFSVDASFVEIEKLANGGVTVVLLTADGRKISTRLDKLSAADQAYVATLIQDDVPQQETNRRTPSNEAVRLAKETNSNDLDDVIETLCTKGKYQIALDLLRLMLTSGEVDAAATASIAYRQADVEMRFAEATPGTMGPLRDARRLRAILYWDRFAKNYPDHELARVGQHRAGKAYRSMAESRLLEAGGRERRQGRSRDDLLREARENYQGEHSLLIKQRGSLIVEQVENQGKTKGSRSAREVRQAELARELIAIEFELAGNLKRQALAFDGGTEQYVGQLQLAADAFEQFFERYSKRVIGLKAMLMAGTCYRDMGRIDTALSCFEDIVGDRTIAGNDSVLDLRHESLHLAFDLWCQQIEAGNLSLDARTKFEHAYRLSGPKAKGKRLERPENLAIVFQRTRLALTFALKFEHVKIDAVRKRRERVLRDAVQGLKLVSRIDGPDQQRAQELLSWISRDPDGRIILAGDQHPVAAAGGEGFDLARFRRPTANVDVEFEGVRGLIDRGLWNKAESTLNPNWLGRVGLRRGSLVRRGGGTVETEQAVDAGLMWLALHQNGDGSWNFVHTPGGRCSGFDSPGSHDSKMGATGMALLAFLGAGHVTSDRRSRYHDVVRAGIAYLRSNRDVDTRQRHARMFEATSHFQGRMYSHGMATAALVEAYGMTGDSKLRKSAIYALNYIAAVQHEGGGWRYSPGDPGDTSMLGWQFMAIKSAEMASLKVPEGVKFGVSKYLDSVQLDEGSTYGYRVNDGGRRKQTASSAIGLLCRTHLGWDRNHRAFRRGREALAERGPDPNDPYFNYYATMFLFQNDGPRGPVWTKWNKAMRELLVKQQAKKGGEHWEGSWFFAGDVSHGGAQTGGRIYHTAMATMTLEVYYRYQNVYAE